jgi:DNA-binding NarL/FixJ family response regulator
MEARRWVALVADDHELYCAGLSKLLEASLGFDEVIRVRSFDDALTRLGDDPLISLATFDPAMTGMHGVASLQLVRRLCPALRIAVISGSTRRDDVLQAVATGVHGYLPKTLRVAELERALRAILDGRTVVPPGLFEIDRGWREGAAEPATGATAPVELTPRQRQVVRLIAEGKSNKEIARALDLAEGTIKVHVNALYRTLSVRNRASAVAAIAQHGWQRAS